MAGFLCLLAAACGAQGGDPTEPADAAVVDHPASAGGSGGTSTSANGGAGGQSTASGGAGGSPGTGGRATGGAGGSAGQGGTGRRDGAAGSGGRDARAGDATASGGTRTGDGGDLACNDTTSPGRLGVYYYSNSTATGSSIQMYFDVVNFTAYSALLSQVTVRYWFTDEDPTAPNQLEQYYVPLPTTMKFSKVDPPRQGANTVLDIAFTGAGDAGGSFVETRGFNFAFHKSSYAGTYDQGNDYSYDPDLKTTLGQNPRITAYVKGELAWGCEPPLAPPPALDGSSGGEDAPVLTPRDAAAGEARP